MKRKVRFCGDALLSGFPIQAAALCIAAIACLTGCARLTPALSGGSGSTSAFLSAQITEGPASLTPDPSDPVRYRIVEVNHQLLLMADPDTTGDWEWAGQSPYGYLLSPDRTEWVRADYSVRKIGSVGLSGGESLSVSDGKASELYKIQFGSWSCYAILYSRYFQESIEEHWYTQLASGQTNDILPVSRDYAILQYKTDLYAIDRNDSIRQVSSRSVPPYAYDPSKEGTTLDGLDWKWTCFAVCNPMSNRVVYLTSREQTSYAVWQLDIDTGTEKKLCDDLALGIYCYTDRWISIRMNPFHSELYGKLLYLDDCTTAEGMTDEEFDSTQEFWYSDRNWMYRVSASEIHMDNGDTRVLFDSSGYFSPLSLSDEQLWLSGSETAGRMRIVVIDPSGKTCYDASVPVSDAIGGWQHLLVDIAAGQRPVREGGVGYTVTITDTE